MPITKKGKKKAADKAKVAQDTNEMRRVCEKYGVEYNADMDARELAQRLLVGFVDGMSVEDVLNKKEGK